VKGASSFAVEPVMAVREQRIKWSLTSMSGLLPFIQAIHARIEIYDVLMWAILKRFGGSR
jgi:hypothetical protein